MGETARAAVERFLATNPADVGCDQVLELLHAYVELVLHGEEPEIRYPGIAAHLRSCGPCTDDFRGLLAAAGSVPG